MTTWRINVDPRTTGAIGLVVTIITVLTQVPFPPEVPAIVNTYVHDFGLWVLAVWTPVGAYLSLSSTTASGPLSADHLAETQGQVPPSQK